MILYIDTTDFKTITYGLTAKATAIEKAVSWVKTYTVDPHESHQTLAKLDDFFRTSKIVNLKSKISKIIVCKGPGRFTGIRIGVTHAMALGLAWNVPVKAVTKDKFVIV